MNTELIKTLHCPYSGSSFEITNALKFEKEGSDVDYGILTSEAGDFPIVEGILRLRVDEMREPIVELIRKKQRERALLTALEVPFHGKRAAAINFLTRTGYAVGLNGLASSVTTVKSHICQALTDPDASFSEATTVSSSTVGVAGQIYRFSMPTFMPTYPLVQLIEAGSVVLDFGCGTGHGAFLIEQMAPAATIICVDYSFSALFLAKRYFVETGHFICLDGDYPLPFDSGYFGYIFSSDAIHLIDSKLSLAHEFQRCLTDRGTIILPHLHNKLSPIKFGKSLTPEGYDRLFTGMERRIFAEDLLVRQYVCNDVVDLAREPSIDEWNSAMQGVSVIASKDGAVFRRYSGLWQRHTDCMTHPMLNPVYKVSYASQGLLLHKKVFDVHGKAIVEGPDGYLPDVVSLPDLNSTDREQLVTLKQADRARFDEVARRFVVIEAPDRFM